MEELLDSSAATKIIAKEESESANHINDISALTFPLSMATAVGSVDEQRSTAPLAEVKSSNESGRTVQRIVASLIRAAEQSRFHAIDKPDSLDLSSCTRSNLLAPITTTATTATTTATTSTTTIATTATTATITTSAFSSISQQETGTQTSPCSLSRSSSFDWINESPTEDQHSDELIIITSTESPGTSDDLNYSSLNALADCDGIYGEEMLHKTEGVDRLFDKQSLQSSKDIDESIALLMEYVEDLDMIPATETQYPTTRDNLLKIEKNSLATASSVLPRKIQSDSSQNRVLFVNEFLHRFSSPRGHAKAINGLNLSNDTSSLMNDSIYDNVCDAIKQPPKLLVSRLNDAEDSNSSVAIVNSLDANTVSTNQNNNDSTPVVSSERFDDKAIMLDSTQDPQIMPDHSVLSNDITVLSHHDISINSELADSESFPLTSEVPRSIDLHRGDNNMKQHLNPADKNRNRVAPVKISSSGEIHTDGSTGVRTPPPPSPRSNLEKQPPSTVLTSDLFAFSAGRVPQRAESCEELDVAFTEQTNEELYSQKKQKAGKFIF